MTVGSSPKTSSPTSATYIALRMPSDGRVTVSLRRSTRSFDIESILHLFGGTQHCARLGFRLAPLHLVDRVGHNACCRLRIQHVAHDHAGADRDREIHVTGERQISHCTAVDPALD